jgi:demethylmenaquinone methyltransferase/2-methoxy-6-polyprenyl-1,4-benzoquinol methylase
MVQRVKRCHPHSVLDVATGTGDSAIALKKSGATRIVGVDISAQMLEVAKQKKRAAGIELMQADGEHLPFGDATFDVVTIAFGIRNFEKRAQGLQEMRRALKEGGTLVVLELSMPSGAAQLLYKLYFWGILPLVGRLISRNAYAYRYLPRSVNGFPPQEAFVAELRNLEFREVKVKRLSGGLATIYEAKK